MVIQKNCLVGCDGDYSIYLFGHLSSLLIASALMGWTSP